MRDLKDVKALLDELNACPAISTLPRYRCTA